jgi:hypothetical protein
MAGFWSAVAFADLELEPPLSWGVVKGLLLRNLRYWARQRDILTGAGTLTIGYNYPNQFISENYNSHGSTYWFMLSFAALALPESHEFWRCKEEPYPSASLPPVVPLKHPMHIMVRRGGHTFLLSSGQACHYPMRASESKYGKFAYSSAFAYSVPTGGYFVEAIGGDNTLALSDDAGETWKVRRKTLDAKLEMIGGSPVLISSWKPWADVCVETYLLPPTEDSPNWHLRVHHVQMSGNRALQTSEGAFALHGVSQRPHGRELLPMEDTDRSEGRLAAVGVAVAVSRGGAVGILDIYPQQQQNDNRRHGRVLDEDANSNLMESRSVLPSLAMDIPARAGRVWLVSAVFAMPASVPDYENKWHEAWTGQRPSIPPWVKN